MVDQRDYDLPPPLPQVLRLARQDGLPVAVCLLLVGVTATSLDRAGWVRNLHPAVSMSLALILGLLLARSRLGGMGASLYLALLFAAGASERVGQVLPPWGRLAPGDWVWALHLRSLTLAQRVAGWAVTLAAGGVVQDTGLFVGVFSLVVWAACAWLAWWALRRKQALVASLPLGLILAVNIRLSAQSWAYLWAFVVSLVPLLAGLVYAWQRADWDRRAVDYPNDLSLDWFLPVLAMTLAIGSVTAVAPILGTPSGWRLLGDIFRAPRDEVAETASQLFSGVTPPQVEPARQAVTPDLGHIGAPIDQGNDTIMWVQVNDPAPPVVSQAQPYVDVPQHYWRNGLFATYTGTGWQPLTEALLEAGAGSEPGPPPAGRYALRQRFEIVAQHGADLFAVSQPVTASAGAKVVAAASAGAFEGGTALVQGATSSYSVLSWATRVSVAELRAAPTDYPPGLRAEYLQLPGSLPQRVRGLAAEITRGAGDNYERALRIETYLRAVYVYQLDVPMPPPGRDAVDYFLFEAPGGFCTYYASAMAVMLRAEGVPARVATGYAMGEFTPERGAYRVPGAAAHAWVEVYFPGYGWVEFEPTPVRSVFRHAEGEAVVATTADADFPKPRLGPARLAAIALAALAGLAALALAWRWWRRGVVPDPQARTPRGQALRLYYRWRAALGRAGLPGSSATTPDEYLAASTAALAGRRSLLDALAQTTALQRRAAYSQHAVDDQQVSALRRQWARARVDWLRLWLGRLRPGTRSRSPAGGMVQSGRRLENGDHG